MNCPDSPLEALAFIPLNLAPLLSATVNNLWAWLAVITAAFSFWRLRSSSSVVKTTSSHITLSPPPPPPTPIEPTPTTSFIEEEEEENEEERVLTRGNSKKFFTVYVEERENDDQEDIDNHDDHDEMDGGDEVDDEKNDWVVIKRWGSSSELTVEMRGGDLGWYSYQNRKVIDGSVVRLWGEERESGGCDSPRSCRKRKNLIYPLNKLFASKSF